MLERLRAALAPEIEVEGVLGSGGMGLVFRGRDTRLDRPLAIKVLKPELNTAVYAERFLREARHAGRLQHPNVVPVHKADEADGLPYYTMDLIPGGTLAARLEGGPLAPAEVIRLGLDLLAALGAAHRHKLIHRDVKPSNIFLGRDRALLGDFGIAFAIDSTATLTDPDELRGTLAYMSPEQLHGRPVSERTDIYAVGLVLFEAATGRRWLPLTDPSKGEWTAVPRHLRGPIHRALELDPKARWPRVDAFAKALAPGDHTHSASWATRAVLAALVGILIWLGLEKIWHPQEKSRAQTPIETIRDLAVFPFDAAGMADTSIGPILTGRTQLSLDLIDGLTLVPGENARRAWRLSSLPPARRLVELTGNPTGSRYGVWANVRPHAGQLEVQLEVVGPGGKSVFRGSVLGPAHRPDSLGDSLARVITHAASLGHEPMQSKEEAWARIPKEAVDELLLGQEAQAYDAWLTAERHYLRAFQIDSTFVLAGWRLGNARRWLPLRAGPAYPPGLFQLLQDHRNAVPVLDRILIEAQFRPSGGPRFARYKEALLVAGDDPYAALLYGDELFHRGPLAGRDLDEAVSLLDSAVKTGPTLAPAWEHLTWVQIRLGNKEPAESALTQLERWAGPPEDAGIPLPALLRMAYGIRFGDSASRQQLLDALSQSPHALLAARGALSFDLPAAQVVLGTAVSRSGKNAAVRAGGLIGRGVALVTLGRPAEGQVSFDSAAQLFADPHEARFQAAEWRVIPAALGVPGWSEAERQRGRDDLRRMTADPRFHARAAWALALDAGSRGDTVAARTLSAGIGIGDSLEALSAMLAGLDLGARREWKAALSASEPALAFDSAGRSDPFLRAALHLKRGEWFDRSGQTADADRSWLWYENLDVVGWPAAEVQAAEVDWALGNHARTLRARLALAAGDQAKGCRLARRVSDDWTHAEATLAATRAELAMTIRQHCRS